MSKEKGIYSDHQSNLEILLIAFLRCHLSYKLTYWQVVHHIPKY